MKTFEKRHYIESDSPYAVVSYFHGEGHRIYPTDTRKEAKEIYKRALSNREFYNGATLSIMSTSYDNNRNQFYLTLS